LRQSLQPFDCYQSGQRADFARLLTARRMMETALSSSHATAKATVARPP
jgi:hypothetical protein